MIALITTAASQSTCGEKGSFTISSNTYPGSNGCYNYAGLTEKQDPLFSSQQEGGNSLVIISESVFDPNFDQYYLFFYRADGETVLCASSTFAYKIDHPVNIDEEGGWSFCYTEDGNQDVAIGEIDITCGCEETVEPTAEPTEESVDSIEDSVDSIEDSVDSDSIVDSVDSDSIEDSVEKEIEDEEEMIESLRESSSAYPLDVKYLSFGGAIVIGYIFSMMF